MADLRALGRVALPHCRWHHGKRVGEDPGGLVGVSSRLLHHAIASLLIHGFALSGQLRVLSLLPLLAPMLTDGRLVGIVGLLQILQRPIVLIMRLVAKLAHFFQDARIRLLKCEHHFPLLGGGIEVLEPG